MSLDKWLSPEKKNESIKKKKRISGENSLKTGNKTPNIRLKKLSKYILECSKSKCKYQKTIVKITLTENDKICPKCKSNMKLNYSAMNSVDL